VLERANAAVDEERSSRQSPLTDADARSLLAKARRVRIARGRAHRELHREETTLDDLKGPTGNYRAPLVLTGGTLLVGFQPETLAELL
jgi:hypothetical protein